MADPLRMRAAVKPFEQAHTGASLFQFASSVGLFLGACVAMYWSLRLSYVLTLALAVPTGALLVRVFIIQHDCGHGSFFAARWANDLVGSLCSLLTLTPYANWRRHHAHHHASWNNLDKHGASGDLYSACMTVAQYKAMPRLQRFLHRLPRHPLVAHVVLPPLVFLFVYRIPFETPDSWRRETRAVYWLNGALALSICGLAFAVGIVPVLMVHIPVIVVTSTIGVWLFAVQHRFDTARWERQDDWNFAGAALEGSSFLKLPRILQWFSGNIGYHNVHHFAPRVPNYRLERCYRSVEGLKAETPLTLRAAWRAIGLSLWCEERQRLVRFKDVRRATD